MTRRSPAGRLPHGQSAGHGQSAEWGSAGAMSGPPQMNKVRIRLIAENGLSADWGSAGPFLGPRR